MMAAGPRPRRLANGFASRDCETPDEPPRRQPSSPRQPPGTAKSRTWVRSGVPNRISFPLSTQRSSLRERTAPAVRRRSVGIGHADPLLLGSIGLPAVARADLDAYIKKAEPAFAWTQSETATTSSGVVTSIKLTSQVWQGITWKHELRVYEPLKIVIPTPCCSSSPGATPTARRRRRSQASVRPGPALRARVAVLPQVPNQPLLDGKTEDELIAETFVRYLQTKDENWPLLFPMVKSAVRAMDALQAGQGKRQAA